MNIKNAQNVFKIAAPQQNKAASSFWIKLFKDVTIKNGFDIYRGDIQVRYILRCTF